MPKEPRRPVNPRTRATLYGVVALYLAYLFFQIAAPYLTHDPYGPTTLQFVLGVVILGGGAVALGILAWKMYRSPLPEEPEEAESASLPEDGGQDQK